MRKISAINVARSTAMAAAILFATSAMPPRASAQTKHANDTFMLVSRSDRSRVNMHVEGRGDHCWATSEDDFGDVAVGVGIGDDRCTIWDEGADDGASMRARITPSKVSFRLDGKSYAITDAATVKRARGLFEPLVAIGDQQSELGQQQRALGSKEREFGRQQREVKVEVPDMSADIQRVEADAKRLSSQGGTQSELGDLQSEIGDLQSRLGDLQSQAGEEQSKLGAQQSKLGDQQSVIGDQQSALGDKSQKTARDIANNLQAMLKQAVQSGVAKPE